MKIVMGSIFIPNAYIDTPELGSGCDIAFAMVEADQDICYKCLDFKKSDFPEIK